MKIKEIIKIGLILFAITAVSAFLLAFANKVTAPVIQENDRKKTEESMKLVLSDADSFEKVDYSEENIEQVYIAKSSSAEFVGCCVVALVNGYGGELKVMTGIDKELNVTGVDILSHSETPGLGANAANDSFKGQFVGKTSGISAVKGEAKENEIAAMSGATITSKAVTQAVNNALEVAEKVKEY